MGSPARRPVRAQSARRSLAAQVYGDTNLLWSDLTLLPELYTICDFSFQSGEDAYTFFHHRRADLNRFDPAAQHTECLDPTGHTSYTDDVEPSSGGAKNHLGL